MLTQKPSTSDVAEVSKKKKANSVKILVIDDEPEITDIIETFLENAGYQVKSENSSVIGIERAKTFLPDLILLDIMMPFMDGYQVCRELKKSPDRQRCADRRRQKF
jgi:CheY-like chemotaxis protein